MKYALFVVSAPSRNALSVKSALSDFIHTIPDIELAKDTVEILSPGLYQCDLEFGMESLSMLVTLAKEMELQSRTLFFEEEPAWVISK